MNDNYLNKKISKLFLILKRTTLFVMLFFLASCVTPIPMEQIAYVPEKPFTEKYTFESIEFTTGRVDGSLYIPAYVKTPNLFFGEEDHAEFIKILKRELSLQGVTFGLSGYDKVKVDFVDSFYESNQSHYELKVKLTIFGEQSYEKLYEINSNDGLSYWKTLNTTPNQHRNRAAEMLLNRVMNDISSYIERNG